MTLIVSLPRANQYCRYSKAVNITGTHRQCNWHASDTSNFAILYLADLNLYLYKRYLILLRLLDSNELNHQISKIHLGI